MLQLFRSILFIFFMANCAFLPRLFSEFWTNCIGNQFCYPCRIYEPKSLEELCTFIKKSSAQGLKVRAIGNGFSISDIGCSNGCLLNLKNLRKILFVDLDNKIVRVEAGITLQELNEELARQGLALSNQPAIASSTLGGAISTGTHGTGHTGSLSSFVTEFELITDDGCLHKISSQSDPEAFSALQVSLGSLGIIYAVTIQCEPLFYLRSISEVSDIQNILQNYKSLNDTNDFFQFFWDVETDKVIINRWNRAISVHENNTSPSYQALPWYVMDEGDKDLFSEIAIPIKSLPEALKMSQRLLFKFRDAGAKFVDINVRFVEQDKQAFLSPSFDGPVAYLTFCLLEEDKYLSFYKEFEEAMLAFEGRPHWGKIHFLNHTRAKKLYGTNLEKFIKVKKKLDPNETFSNDFSNRICNKD